MLTSDVHILSIVQGCPLEFYNPPCQVQAPRATKFCSKEADIATTETNKLLTKGVIRKATHDRGKFISNQQFSPGPKKMVPTVSI